MCVFGTLIPFIHLGFQGRQANHLVSPCEQRIIFSVSFCKGDDMGTCQITIRIWEVVHQMSPAPPPPPQGLQNGHPQRTTPICTEIWLLRPLHMEAEGLMFPSYSCSEQQLTYLRLQGVRQCILAKIVLVGQVGLKLVCSTGFSLALSIHQCHLLGGKRTPGILAHDSGLSLVGGLDLWFGGLKPWFFVEGT